MIATTPSGTRTRLMRRPLGRIQPSGTSPTGSGSAATWRSPPAMAAIRASVEPEPVEQAGRHPGGFLAVDVDGVGRRGSRRRGDRAGRPRRAARRPWRRWRRWRAARGRLGPRAELGDRGSRHGECSGHARVTPGRLRRPIGQTRRVQPDPALGRRRRRVLRRPGPRVRDLAGSVDGIDGDAVAGDVQVEAYNLAAAFIDGDGLHTDHELWAFIATFGPRFGGTLDGPPPPTCGRPAWWPAGVVPRPAVRAVRGAPRRRRARRHRPGQPVLRPLPRHRRSPSPASTSMTAAGRAGRHRGLPRTAARPDHRDAAGVRPARAAHDAATGTAEPGDAPSGDGQPTEDAELPRPGRSTSCWPSWTSSSASTR